MKSLRSALVPASLLLLLANLLATPAACVEAPAITRVRGRSVWVEVPPGYERVTLQQRTGARLQSWRSLASKRVAEAGGTVGFVTKTAAVRRNLRVIGKLLVPPPVVVPPLEGVVPNLLGPVVFPEEPFGLEFDIKGDDPNIRLGNVLNYGITLFGTATTASPTPTFQGPFTQLSMLAPAAAAEPASEPVEPDIWKLSGDRLFFSNPLRGLQVFDVSQPDDPGLLGELRLPDQGAEIHFFDDQAHAVVITAGSSAVQIFDGVAYFKALRDGVDHRTLPPEIINQGSGHVIVAELKDGVPRETGRAHFRGKYFESRLVGTKLYVVSDASSFRPDWDLTSFDLSDPAQPVPRGRLSISGYELGVAAADRFLFLFRRTGYGQSRIDIIDISAPGGALRQRGQITTAGDVVGKFSVALRGEVLTVVSSASASYAVGGSPRNKVETFSMANPDAPALLGRLEIGPLVGPGQFTGISATRFDGDRLYLSEAGGALRIIDLSMPTAPMVVGETSAPGVVSHLEPLGDRLVALGKVFGKVAVSLVDVADPAHPFLLSQVTPGPPLPSGASVATANNVITIEVGGSTSEALANDKALEILPEQGLILIPFSSLGLGAAPGVRLQLIDLERDTLKLRGVLDHGAKARRATVHRDRIVAVSATSLVTADHADRDRPKVTSDVEIAWRSDHVFLEGEHLIQVGDRLSEERNSLPKVTVARAEAPDAPLSEAILDDYKVLGATARGGRLYVLQNGPNRGLAGYFGGALVPAVIVPNELVLSVFDLTQLPKLTRLGQIATVNHFPSVTRARAVWPTDDLMVWTGTAGAVGFSGPITLDAAPPTNGELVITPVTGPSTAPLRALDCDVAAYDVSAPAEPRLATLLRVYSGNFGAFSAAFAADGRVFYSYKRYSGSPDANTDNVSRAHRHFMRVIDFRAGNQPTVSAEINVPGRLIGVSPEATRLYTAGQRYDSATGDRRAGAAIHASDFRHGLAKLTGQLPLDDPWTPFAVDGETCLLGSWVAPQRFANSHVQAWQTDGAGAFQLRSEIAVPPVERLRLVDQHLLVGQWGGASHFYDVSDPARITDLGERGDRVGHNLTDAVGAPDRGLWVPLGDAGSDVIDLAR